MYLVELTEKAQYEFNKIPISDQDRIAVILDRLSANKRPPVIRKIYGNIYRIRIGDWHIIYAFFSEDRLVLVGKIVHRS